MFVIYRATALDYNSAEAAWPAFPLQMWEQIGRKFDRRRQYNWTESLSYSWG